MFTAVHLRKLLYVRHSLCHGTFLLDRPCLSVAQTPQIPARRSSGRTIDPQIYTMQRTPARVTLRVIGLRSDDVSQVARKAICLQLHARLRTIFLSLRRFAGDGLPYVLLYPSLMVLESKRGHRVRHELHEDNVAARSTVCVYTVGRGRGHRYVLLQQLRRL